MSLSRSYSKQGLAVFLFSYFVSLFMMAYLSFVYEGVDLKEVKRKQPGESTPVSNQALSFTKEEKSKFWVISPAWIQKGQVVYKSNCASCHGVTGLGDGPVSQTMVPPPRNLVKGGWVRGGLSHQLFTSISKGLSGTSMVAFGHLPLEDRWAVVHYIRSITKDKPKDNLKQLEQFAKESAQ